MSVKGWIVHLPSPSYSTPSRCASCLGPKETEIKVQATSKSGNIRTTLTMSFPYCTACAQRAAKERVRGLLVFLGAMMIGGACALAFAFANVFVELPIREIVAAILAIPAAIGLALVTRPPLPAAPATARGDAIFLRSTSGDVLCTNEAFAQSLAQANRTGARPGSKWMTTESWAPFAVLLGGGMAIAGFAYWAPGSMLQLPREHDYSSTPGAYSPPPHATPAPTPLRPRR